MSDDSLKLKPVFEEPESNKRPPYADAHKKTYGWGYLTICCAVLAGIVLFFGYSHIVTSSKGKTRVISKIVFSFNETLVSMDEITGMPILMARTKYPLTVKALQRDGIIGSDEEINKEFFQRVEQKLKKFGY